MTFPRIATTASVAVRRNISNNFPNVEGRTGRYKVGVLRKIVLRKIALQL